MNPVVGNWLIFYLRLNVCFELPIKSGPNGPNIYHRSSNVNETEAA